jgi:hypothetical protein
MRDASNLWKLVGDRHGVEKRDGLWSHPDLMPTAEDLDEPIDFADRVGETGSLDDLDPIAELERTQQSEQSERSEREQKSKDTPPEEGETPA